MTSHLSVVRLKIRAKNSRSPKHQGRTKCPPQKIDVSKSGDMAYEYGTGSLSFDSVKEKKHFAFELAYLRLWKAVDGECRAAATMTHPIESTIKETPIAAE